MWKIRIKGFTFIELIITASILGTVSIAVFATFISGLNVYRKAQVVITAQADVFLALEMMEKDLKNALNLSLIGFSGGEKELSFASLEEKEALILGKTTYYFNQAKHALFKKQRYYDKFMPADNSKELDDRQVVLLEDIKFSYYYFNKDSQKYEWIGQWEKADEFPRIVKMEVIFKSDNMDVRLFKKVFMPVAA